MWNHNVFCFIFTVACCLSCVAMRIGSRDVGDSLVTYRQKAGDFDTGCLLHITVNNTVSDFTYTPDEERSFLLELYNKTGGPNYWFRRTGWRENSSIHHCDWFGIECYKNSSYIKWISLGGNRLVGRPPNFWRFRNLQGICLAQNKEMNGTIADLIAGNMTRLRRLAISFTGVYGLVPWRMLLELHDLEKLQICCMHSPGGEKKLHGSIPHDIGRLDKLQVLSLGENRNIQGNLPPSIANLTKLWFLDLEYITLESGELSYLSNMSKLEYLHLTHCGLRTTLPSDFGRTHPNIIELLLNGNKIEGELEDECFHGMENITQLYLGSNNLHGLIPAALSNIKSLQVLDLSKNGFTGFAENMTFNSQLETLFIDGNVNLKVDAERFLKALLPCKDNLRMLMAKNSGLKGGITSAVYSIWKFGKIMYIDLSHNHMTGPIPLNGPQYSVPYLFSLSFASNNFTGELPISFFTPLKSLTYLDIRGNRYMKSKSTVLNTFLNATFAETLHEDRFTCPTLRFTNSGGRADIDPGYYEYSLCLCNRGYYGYSNYCEPCMKGATCEVETSQLKNITVKKSKDHIKIEMIIGKGYWPCCGDFDNVTRLVKCSQEEKFDDEICSPSGDCKCELKLMNGELKTICNSSCICRYGNKDRLCSQCIDGYYKKGSVCISCPAFRENFTAVITVSFVVCLILSVALLILLKHRRKLVLVLIFLFAVTLIVLHLMSIIPGWFFVIICTVWILGLSGAGRNLGGFLCIAVFFFQSLDAMFSDANIWPTTIILLKYQVTNVFNFGISEQTCTFSTTNRPEVSFAAILLLPLIGILLVWLLYVLVLLGKLVRRCQNMNVPSSSCKRKSIQILLFMYFPITAKTFGAVKPCEHREGLSYLKDAPWLDCEGTSYNWLLALGSVSLVVFVIGVPLFVFTPLLYKYLNHAGQVAFEETDIWLKPLYEPYKTQHRRYFPIVFLVRRLLLAVFLTIVPTTSSYQVVGITLLLPIYMIIILVFRPYQPYSERFEFETMAEVIVSIVLLLSFVGLALLRVSPKFDTSFVWLIISLNLVVVLCCLIGLLGLLVVNLWKSSDRYEQIAGEINAERPEAGRQQEN